MTEREMLRKDLVQFSAVRRDLARRRLIWAMVRLCRVLSVDQLLQVANYLQLITA